MDKLPQNAEDEDIEDRQNEIDEYCAKLSNIQIFLLTTTSKAQVYQTLLFQAFHPALLTQFQGY